MLQTNCEFTASTRQMQAIRGKHVHATVPVPGTDRNRCDTGTAPSPDPSRAPPTSVL